MQTIINFFFIYRLYKDIYIYIYLQHMKPRKIHDQYKPKGTTTTTHTQTDIIIIIIIIPHKKCPTVVVVTEENQKIKTT